MHKTYGHLSRFVHYSGLAIVAIVVMGHSIGSIAQDEALRIIAFGDSLTAGYLLPSNAAFPNVLERRLRASGTNVNVINAGVSGDTASNGAERLDWAIGDRADGLILELGANDMLRGLDPDITYRALTDIVVRSKKKGLKVLLIGMVAAPGLGREFENRFNGIFPRIAREQEVPLYPFFLEGVAGNPKLLLQDGLHPTAAGVESIVDAMLPTVKEFVASIR